MVVKTSQVVSDDFESVTVAYPTVETVHEDSICKLVYAPARQVPRKTLKAAQDLARRAVSTFLGTGVFGVELFLLGDDTLLVNEIAPRPHNSGHYSIEACHMSSIRSPCEGNTAGSSRNHYLKFHRYESPSGHDAQHTGWTTARLSYASRQASSFNTRSAGTSLRQRGRSARAEDGTYYHDRHQYVRVRAEDVSTDSAGRCGTFRTPKYICFFGYDSRQPSKSYARRTFHLSRLLLLLSLWGSDTDLATLKPGLLFLDEMEVPYSVTITSAHRTPQFMIDYGKAAAGRGIKAIIAAAGGAAHLPGMIASVTSVPVHRLSSQGKQSRWS